MRGRIIGVRREVQAAPENARRWWLPVLGALLTSGCLVTGQAGMPLPDPEEIGPAPVCHGAAQCEAMWAAVEPALQVATGRRIQSRQADAVETFDFTDAGLLHGRASRRPLPQGGYEIIGEFRCGRPACAVNEARALQRFHALVGQAGAGY